MVPTRKKKQHNKKLFCQLSESDADFMVTQNNHGAKFEIRANTVGRDTSLNYSNDPTLVNSSQVDMHTLDKNIVSKVGSEVDSLMTTIETRVQDAVMTAIKNLLILG